MSESRPPVKMMFGRDWFYFVTSRSRPHDAKVVADDIQRKGHRIRIVMKANKHCVYKGIKRGNRFNRVV